MSRLLGCSKKVNKTWLKSEDRGKVRLYMVPKGGYQTPPVVVGRQLMAFPKPANIRDAVTLAAVGP
ncbi:hypothetical protein J1614_004338 [Plenodomus biglobosus]|nr:hypothetical protein J1614_004338 [Plenodomus biglobosus]